MFLIQTVLYVVLFVVVNATLGEWIRENWWKRKQLYKKIKSLKLLPNKKRHRVPRPIDIQ